MEYSAEQNWVLGLGLLPGQLLELRDKTYLQPDESVDKMAPSAGKEAETIRETMIFIWRLRLRYGVIRATEMSPIPRSVWDRPLPVSVLPSYISLISGAVNLLGRRPQLG